MKDSTHEELAFEYANEGLEALYDRKLNKAALSLQAALNLFKEIGNVEEYAKNLNRIGVVYATIGNEAMAMDFFLEGLECAIANELHHISVLFYNNIGSRYMELNEYEKAIAYFDKAEKELAYEDMETRERYASWFLITKLNLMVSYKYLKQYDKAESYLNELEPYANQEINKEYYFTFLISKYWLYWLIGKREEVYEKLDEIVEGALNDESASDYEMDMRDVCGLLKEMGEFEKWQQIIWSFDAYTKEQGTIHAQLALTEMWMDYYKAINDMPKYIHLCVDHAELYQKQKVITDKEQAAAIDMKIELREKEVARRKAEKKSNTDSLTDLGNRYMLEYDIRRLIKDDLQDKKSIAVDILDVDCFKEHNDTYGHLLGDDSLRKIAEVLKDETKKEGSAYRFGGDEFVILLQDVTVNRVEEIAAAIKMRIFELHIENKNSTVGSELTISQGFSVFIPDEECGMGALLEKADQALYKAKESGKNGYVVC